MRGFYVRADFATIARIDATVAYLADALLTLGDNSCLDQRRVKAVLIMANPTQAVRILAAYTAWHRSEQAREEAAEQGTDEQETTGPEPGGPEPVSTEPQRFDPTQTTELLDEKNLLPAVWLFVHLAAGPTQDAAGVGDVARIEGSAPVTTEVGPHPPRREVQVQDHPGPRPTRPGPRRRLGDPRPT